MLHQLRYKNVGPIRDLEIDYRGRPMLLLLAPNEAGKSYVIGAEPALLFGEFPGKPASLYDHITWGEDRMEMEGWGEFFGHEYRALWILKKTKKTRSSEASLWIDGVQVATTPREFRDKAPEYFGDKSVYLAHALSAQKGEGGLETQKDGNRKYDIIISLMGLDWIPEYGEKISAHRKLRAAVLASAQSGLDLLDRTCPPDSAEASAIVVQQIEKAKADLDLADFDLEATEAKVKELEEQKRQADSVAEARRLLVAAEDHLAKCAALAAQLEQAKADLARLAEARTQLTEVRAHQEHRQTYLRAYQLRATARQKTERALERWEILKKAPGLSDEDVAAAHDMEPAVGAYREAKTANDEAQRQHDARSSRIARCKADVRTAEDALARAVKRAASRPVTPGPKEDCDRCDLVKEWTSNTPKMAEEALTGAKCNLADVEGEPVPELQDLAPLIKRGERAREAKKRVDAAESNKLELEQSKLAWEKAETEAAALADPGVEPEDRQKEADELSDLISRLAPAKDLAARAEEAAADLPIRQANVEELKLKIVDTPDVGDRHIKATTAVRAAKAAQTASREAVAQFEKQEAVLTDQGRRREEIISKVGALRQEVSDLELEVQDLAELSAIFDRRGAVPLLLSQNCGGILESTSRIAREIGIDQDVLLSVGSEGKEELGLRIRNQFGEHEMNQFSGGKESLMNALYRVGANMWRLESGRGYTGMGFDEAFDKLHPENVDRMFRLLEIARRVVPQIIVVSHNEAIISRFPHVLRLEPQGNKTVAEWEEAA